MRAFPWRLRLTVCSIGGFGLLAQALLFRDFLTVFDGNELSTGLFFFAWLFWTALGACPAAWDKLGDRAAAILEFLPPLLYLPAFLAQQYLLLHVRRICGMGEYEILSLAKLIPAVFLANAPIGLVNGFLFMVGVRRLRETAVPVTSFYWSDALGSGIGAVAVTLLLYYGMAAENVLLLAGAVLSAVGALHGPVRRSWAGAAAGMTALILTAAVVAGMGSAWQQYNGRREWQRLLHGGTYRGVFVTPQARYLYGDYCGSRVVLAWGGTVATLPGLEEAAANAAANLAECPRARDVLVIGNGMLPVCRLLGNESRIRRIVWLTPDPDFGSALLQVLPAADREGLAKVAVTPVDVRQYLRLADTGAFDLVIMTLGEPSSLVANRYYSADFFRSVRRVLRADGVFSLGFPGGDGYMGRELTGIGASLLATLSSIFPAVVLQPGVGSRFFAGASGQLSRQPEVLAARLQPLAIGKQFPPSGLYTLFDPLAGDFQMSRYRVAIAAGGRELLNRDSSPVLFRYGIFFSLRKMGVQPVWPATLPGPLTGLLVLAMVPVAAILLALGQRWWRRRSGISTVELLWQVGFSSVVGMGMNLWLLLDFQLNYGSIYLWFGLMNAAFMLGLTAGAGMIGAVSVAGGDERRIFLVLGLLLGAVLAMLGLVRELTLPDWLYWPVFFVVGGVCGAWLPAAARGMKRQRYSDRLAAWLLEIGDTL
ncbi:MAG: hypothetical protein PHQ27_08505, partial [Victivallales bacterium]|nr:hypothetical protein [Victivallales bacterium]